MPIAKGVVRNIYPLNIFRVPSKSRSSPVCREVTYSQGIS